jgi:succinyl-CoA synthetase beta subunit
LKLLEYQAKEVFRCYSIETPKEILAMNSLEVLPAADKIGYPLVLKAQVPVGGRGKAGGVKLVKNKEELIEKANEMFQLIIKNCPVDKVLVSQALPYTAEFYLSITLDRSTHSVTIITSSEGGIDIEEISRTQPNKIEKMNFDLIIGLKEYEMKNIFNRIFPSIENKPLIYREFYDLLSKLIKIYFEKDASIVEINPLIVLNNKLVALDAKIIIDDNAIYLHPEFEEMLKLSSDESIQEKMARELGLTYISLDGNIACIVNGAGLAMATMDLVKYFNGEPANFLDIGGSSNPEKMVNALKIIKSNENVKAILVNIFGGITRCDDIAYGLINGLKILDIKMPISVRLIGTNDENAKQILKNEGILVFSNMDDVVKEAVKSVKGDKV